MRVSCNTPPLPSSTVLAAITMRSFCPCASEETCCAVAHRSRMPRIHRMIFADGMIVPLSVRSRFNQFCHTRNYPQKRHSTDSGPSRSWYSERVFHLLHLDYADPLAVVGVVVDEAPPQNLRGRGRGRIAMVAEELGLPLLPGAPMLEPGMRGLVLGGKNQRHIEVGT